MIELGDITALKPFYSLHRRFKEWQHRRNEKNWDAERRRPQNRFRHILDVANEIAQRNPRGVPDLLRAVLRPLQSEYLVGVAELGRDPFVTMTPSELWGRFVGTKLWTAQGDIRGTCEDPQQYPVHLCRDVVLPWPWRVESFISTLATVGSSKIDPAAPAYLRHDRRKWTQDYHNHRVDVWLPWGIAFVSGGNHSICAGILVGEGVIIPNTVMDMGFLLNEVHCDGKNFIETGTEKILGPVTDPRTAAAFELGRLIRSADMPPTGGEWARRNEI